MNRRTLLAKLLSCIAFAAITPMALYKTQRQPETIDVTGKVLYQEQFRTPDGVQILGLQRGDTFFQGTRACILRDNEWHPVVGIPRFISNCDFDCNEGAS